MSALRRGGLALALGLAVTGCARAQELVLNPGLESYSRCPTGIGVIDGYCDDWYRGGVGSTDYMNACGYAPTPPRSGSGDAGLIPWDSSGAYREYLVGTLSAPLVAGTDYRVELWVRLRDGMLVAVQELGAWFSPTRPAFPGTAPPPGIVPQVEHAGGVITDTVNWTLVGGTFTAAGGEQYLTIGNFHDDAGTTTQREPCCGAIQSYYDVDDVSVVAAVAPPPTCLWRSDASSVRPLTPPASSIFMPPTAEDLTLQGPSWQCPLVTGDLENDPNALRNGVPLSFYQVNLATGTLRLSPSGTTIRFEY